MNLDEFIWALTQEQMWYREDIIALLLQHNLGDLIPAIKDNGMYRWYPEEVVHELALYRESIASPSIDASVKHIPSFLLKTAQ